MKKEAFVVIDIQNDITKNYKEIIENINQAIEKAVQKDMFVVYIKHNNISAGTRTFKPDTKGAELVPELSIVSDYIFLKTKGNALTSEAFANFIEKNEVETFYITGADATACVKSTCYNMRKAGYDVTVLSDCVTSYDKRMPGDREDTLKYFAANGGVIVSIKCLDEGVDIPSTTHALILASSKNPREFIQRRGRILRRSSSKNLSFLYDAIVVPHESSAQEDKSLSIVVSELARAIEFGEHSISSACITDLKVIALRFGVNYNELRNEGYEDDEE